MNLDFGSFNSMILSSALFILIQPLNKINQKEASLYLIRRKSADKDEVHYDDAAIGNFPLRWWKADKAFVKTLLLSLSDIILSYLILSYLFCSYLVLPYLILSYLISPYLILSYLIWSYLIGNFLLRWWEADKAFVKTFLSDPNLAPRLKAQCCKCLFISLTSLCLFNPL